MSISRRCLTGLWIAFLVAAFGCEGRDRAGQARRDGPPVHRQPLRIVVMDPLAAPLACECVAGYAQRDYGKLGTFMEKRLRRPIEIAHAEDLREALRINPGKVHLIIGKRSVVVFDAARTKTAIRPLAMLTDKTGSTDLTGLIVVRHDDSAKSVAELNGRRILLGPEDSDERHSAAAALFKARGAPLPAQVQTKPSCNEAALAVVEGQADAAVISSYAMPLLEGCDVIDKGALRVLARTRPVPFVAVFATASVAAEDAPAILAALLAVRTDGQLLAEMESKDGFVPATAPVARPGGVPDGAAR